MIKHIKTYKWSILLLVFTLISYIFRPSFGLNIIKISSSNILEMLMLIPPIFILMGLMDVWVPKDTLTKLLGTNSGIKGIFIAFILGTAAAGPLYVAFPIGTMLLKKGASLTNVLFFLGVWSSTKLPLLIYEAASFGMNFTLIHIGLSLPLYLLTAFLIEESEKYKKNAI